MTTETNATKNNNLSVRHSQPNGKGERHLSHSDSGIVPRLLNRQQAASYCGLSVQGFSQWVKVGRLPGSLPGTARWDMKAIDAALDSVSGVADREDMPALDQWKVKHARSS
jgi:hypothetical protein